MKALSHPSRKDDHFRPMLQQLLHICTLNTGPVARLCFEPVPFARAAGEKFRIFIGFGFALDFESAPRNLRDARRTIADLHDKNT